MNNLWERGWASLAWRKKSSLSRKVCDQLTRGIHAATTTTSSPVMSRTGFKEYCLKLWNEEKIEIAFIKSYPNNQNIESIVLGCALYQNPRQNCNLKESLPDIYYKYHPLMTSPNKCPPHFSISFTIIWYLMWTRFPSDKTVTNSYS